MTLSNELNQFKIPMLGKFLGGAMQHTKGSFIEGEVYVITAYNPADDTVQTTGNTTRNRWVDASAFDVTRNTAWSFRHGHLSGMEGIIGDIAKFEDHGHDDHVEAMSFDCGIFPGLNMTEARGPSKLTEREDTAPLWMGIDLSNSPDYSVSGRYIGANWPELQELPRPARRLSADEELSLKQVLRRQGKSMYNHLFATGHVDSLRASAKERRFASLGKDVFLEFRPQAEAIKMLKSLRDVSFPTDDIAEAMLATVRSMGVSPKLLGPNCRCAMPELKKGLHSEFTGMIILDDTYIASIEDGKPTFSAPFVRTAIEANEKMTKTITARLERSMNAVHLDTSAMPEVYNRMVECERDIGAFVKGCTYRAMVTGSGPGIKVEHPHTAVPMPVPRDYFKTTGPIPCAVDDRDAPFDPDFEGDIAGYQQIELPEESTFVHKSATRKTQEVHEENDGTADLRKYRFTPDTQ